MSFRYTQKKMEKNNVVLVYIETDGKKTIGYWYTLKSDGENRGYWCTMCIEKDGEKQWVTGVLRR